MTRGAVAFKVRWPFFLRSDLPLPEGVASVTIFVVAIKTYLGVLIEFIPQVGFEEDCETKCLCWWAEIAPEPGGEKREHGLGCLHGRRDGGETCVGCLPNGVRRITVLTELSLVGSATDSFVYVCEHWHTCHMPRHVFFRPGSDVVLFNQINLFSLVSVLNIKTAHTCPKFASCGS